MPEVRSKQIAMAAAYLGISGHEFIQSAITAALLSLCDQGDKTFAYMLSRAAGVEFETLEFAVRQEALANVIVTPKP